MYTHCPPTITRDFTAHTLDFDANDAGSPHLKSLFADNHRRVIVDKLVFHQIAALSRRWLLPICKDCQLVAAERAR